MRHIMIQSIFIALLLCLLFRLSHSIVAWFSCARSVRVCLCVSVCVFIRHFTRRPDINYQNDWIDDRVLDFSKNCVQGLMLIKIVILWSMTFHRVQLNVAVFSVLLLILIFVFFEALTDEKKSTHTHNENCKLCHVNIRKAWDIFIFIHSCG